MTQRKGVVLPSGSGARHNPVTEAVSKRLMPIYDRPVI